MSRITKDRMLGVLGGLAAKPARVWEKQFDDGDEQLRALARCDWDCVRDEDLWFYLHDLTYVELQPDLFRHLFPACLKFWYDTLMRNDGAERGDADFHRALLHRNVPQMMMSAAERARLDAFFVDGFLDRLDQERGFVYAPAGRSANAFIGRFNTLGIAAPIIPDIWRAWWSFETPGQAVSALMYASGLAYFGGDNPIYQPWTPKEGGGGPYLTESDASIFDRGWRPDNLAFLTAILTPDYVVERMAAAAEALSGEPEEGLARELAKDAPARRDIIALRIEDLLANLARTKQAQERWQD